MPRSRARNGLRALAAGMSCAVCLTSLGCRREEPGPGPPAHGGSTTRAADSGPAVEIDPADRRLIGGDEADDPATPRALPGTDELAGWIRGKVEVGRGGELGRLIRDPARRAAIESFRLELAARCRYDLKAIKADVLFIQAETPDDAFGTFSVLSSGPGKWNQADGSVRAAEVSSGRRAMFGWQGKSYVEVRFAGPLNESSERSCRRLFGRIMFNVPAADLPLLMRVVPQERLAGARVWMVRSTAALAAAGSEALRNLDAAGMDARLGLSGDELLSAAAVQVAEDERPNLIWLVHYDKPAGADAAHKRCESALQSPEGDLDRNTIILEPKGAFLAGSWTADQESIRPLLPLLREALPE